MIAAWMLYAAGCAALLAGAAAALDRALRLAGRATRGVWAAAIAGSLLLPAAVLLPRPTPSAAPSVVATETTRTDATQLAALIDAARAQARTVTSPAERLGALDRPLAALWLASSAAMLGWLALSHQRLRRRARAWRTHVVGDQRVLLSADVGPAVVGITAQEVVLPAWALALDERSLELMLAHEREHVRTADPLLLGAGALAAALVPWNPAVWWQLHRLRLAVEMDCDARVLRRHPDVRTYGRLLLDVARHAPSGARLPVAALTSPATSLERRIRTMTMRRPRHASAHVAVLSAATALLVFAACEAPRPTAPVPRSEAPLTAITSTSPSVMSAEGVSNDALRGAIATHLPELRTRRGTPQRAWFVLDARGTVVQALRGDDVPPTTPLRTQVDGMTVTGDAPRGRVRFEASKVSVEDGVPAGLATIDPASIRSIDVRKLAPGQLTPDSLSVVWIELLSPAEVAARRPGMKMRVPFEATLRPSVRDERSTRQRLMAEDSVSSTMRMRQPSRLALARDDSARAITYSRRGGAVEQIGLRRPLRAAGEPEPLYVVNGRELRADEADARIRAMNPADIAKIEALDAGGAVARFGSRARGGAILITLTTASGITKY